MILKTADDKSPQIAQLAQWLTDPTLSAQQKQWLTDELLRLRTGIQGERDAAFYLDSHFKSSQNYVLIHDLRLEVEGDAVQIDHMALYRGGGLETKNFNGSLVINDHGEFTADYGRMSYGIPAPIEQSRRHEGVLQKLFEKLNIGARTGKKLDVHHVVLVHPKAIIKRPPENVFSTRNVIKADQIPVWHQKFVDAHIGPLEMVSMLANMRSQETLKEWGEQLVRQHQPAPQRCLPEHLFPAKASGAATSHCTSPAAQIPSKDIDSTSEYINKSNSKKKLICADCGI